MRMPGIFQADSPVQQRFTDEECEEAREQTSQQACGHPAAQIRMRSFLLDP